MQKRKMKLYYLRKHITDKDDEGNVIESYGNAIEGKAIIWPAGGKIQAQMYGLRLKYIINLNYYGNVNIEEKDGLCIKVSKNDDPDYEVIAIREYSKFKVIEAEKRIT